MQDVSVRTRRGCWFVGARPAETRAQSKGDAPASARPASGSDINAALRWLEMQLESVRAVGRACKLYCNLHDASIITAGFNEIRGFPHSWGEVNPCNFYP